MTQSPIPFAEPRRVRIAHGALAALALALVAFVVAHTSPPPAETAPAPIASASASAEFAGDVFVPTQVELEWEIEPQPPTF